MLPELKRYFASINRYSNLDPTPEGEVVRELETHLQEEIQELYEAGFSAPGAIEEATRRFGSAKEIGQGIYEAHGRGTWWQTLLSVAPHVLIAVTFALHLWRTGSWLLVISIVIGGVIICAWYRGRPVWYYSWLGYFSIILIAALFLILVIIGQAMVPLAPGSAAFWAIIVTYVAVAVCVLGCIVIRVVRRDWLFASLMLLPFPVILVWVVALENSIGLAEYAQQGYKSSDQGLALTFLLLGVFAGVFIRLRQRLLKIGVLSLGTLFIQATVWRFSESALSPVVCFLLGLLLTGLLVSPAILQYRAERKRGSFEVADSTLPEQLVRRT